MPSFLKFSMVAGPKRSLPTLATMNTSAPHSRAATAWFAPLPPNPRSNFCPKMVSPGLGNLSVKVVRSMFALPTTAIRGRFAIICDRDALDWTQEGTASVAMERRECQYTLSRDVLNQICELARWGLKVSARDIMIAHPRATA